jgi:hypothetical protein
MIVAAAGRLVVLARPWDDHRDLANVRGDTERG